MAEKVSYLIFVEPAERKNGRKRNKYVCVCGAEKVIFEQNVKRFNTTSCGCKQKEIVSISNRVHGLRGHSLYQVWNNMIRRCYDEKTPSYHRYGGRGVKVCDEWRSDFKPFYDWAIANGWKAGLQIDKDIKAMELGVESTIYSPDMCLFVTSKVNSNNRITNKIITYKGEFKTVAQLVSEHKISRGTFDSRISRNWDIEKALLTPIKRTLCCLKP